MKSQAKKPIIAMSAAVQIEAAQSDGEKKGPPKFTANFYNGGQLGIAGWDHDVVVDLAGLENGKVLVANLDHDRTKRVGNFAVANDGKTLVANGTASARTSWRDEVVGSAEDGYEWQASLEVAPKEVEFVKAGQSVEANGQKFQGPLYVTRKGILKGFAFVSQGADDSTSVAIAASKEHKMALKSNVKAWVESLGLNAEELTEEQQANFTADFDGREGQRKPLEKKAANPFEARKLEAKRREELREIADSLLESRKDVMAEKDIIEVEKLYEHAIEADMSPLQFKNDLRDAVMPPSHTVYHSQKTDRINSRVMEAAVCMAGRLKDVEKQFDAQTLQAAHDQYRSGIGLEELIVEHARANGYHGRGHQVDLEVQRAAFRMGEYARPIHAAGGFSTLSLPNVLSNVANKFIREGFYFVEQSWREITSIRSVRDFKQITTVSLTGGLMFEQLGPDGEIKHGTIGDEVYINQANTYGRMFAITRKDLINDDLGALTAVPRRLGRGGALKLNDIFWTEWLNPSVSNFWHSNNANVNTGVADMTLGGLKATEVIFLAQTDHDGFPLGSQPRILLVPPGLTADALTLMASERLIDGTGTAIQGDANIWRGRFRVVTSQYLANSSYTGYSAVAWYMLADPQDIPAIELVALNGNIEPTVDTADADFNILGIQMRGYSDVGVYSQEPKAGVRADGGSS